MRLRYELTRLDLFRSGFRSLISQKILWVFGVGLLAFTWWNTFTYEDPNQPKQSLAAKVIVATFSAGIGAAIGLSAGTLFIAIQSFFRRDKGVLGGHTLEITDEGLVESTSVNSSLNKWNSSFQIRERGNYAYIMVSDHYGYAVPRNRLPLEGSLDQFLFELQARIKQPQPNPSTRTDSSVPPPL